VLVALFAATLAALAAARAWRLRQPHAALELLTAFWSRAAITIACAWAVMIVAWPWAQKNPLGRPLIALAEMSRFADHRRLMPFAGSDMHTTDPRWDYLLHYFGLKLPVLVLALLAVATGFALVHAFRRTTPRATRRGWIVLAVATLGPPLYAMATNAILYDGLRHFLFVVPPLCIAAAAGLVAAVRTFWRPLPLIVAAGVLGSVALAVGQLRAMIELHPNQYVYFNQLAGGLHGAYGRSSTDYYGNSYKEAYAELFDHLWR
jgi:hypothetical protein